MARKCPSGGDAARNLRLQTRRLTMFPIARGDLSRGPVNSSDDVSMQVFCPTGQI
jgi:hypothetical protein